MLKHATPRFSLCLSPTPHQHQLNFPISPLGPRFSSGRNYPRTSSTIPTESLANNSRRTEKQDNFFREKVSTEHHDIKVSTFTAPVSDPLDLGTGNYWGTKILSLPSSASSSSSTDGGTEPVITYGKAVVRRGLSFSNQDLHDYSTLHNAKNIPKEFHFNGVMGHTTVMAMDINGIAQTETKSSKGEDRHSLPENPVPKMEVENSPKSKLENRISCPPKEGRNEINDGISVTSSGKVYMLSETDHPSIKSLLRLPGVYGHIPVPENAPQGTPHIINPDSFSLSYTDALICPNNGRLSSRSWSSNVSTNTNATNNSSTSNCSSTSEQSSTLLRVFTSCLRSNIEYKTVTIGTRLTSRQLINLLLSKMKMKHKDPNLFYLTMEVSVKRWSGVPIRALLVLEDSAKPAQLALCRPTGDLKFALQMRKGGVIKIKDTVLMPGSQYKSLLLSHRTTSEEAVQLLLNCYGRRESKIYYALHEVCYTPYFTDRRLGESEKPLQVKASWPRTEKAEFIFVLRRNMSQAISLRKLSMRNLENERDEIFEVRHARLITTEMTNSGPTLIDCTSTTPVLKSFIDEDIHQPNFIYKMEGIDDPNQNSFKNDSNKGGQVRFIETRPTLKHEGRPLVVTERAKCPEKMTVGTITTNAGVIVPELETDTREIRRRMSDSGVTHTFNSSKPSLMTKELQSSQSRTKQPPQQERVTKEDTQLNDKHTLGRQCHCDECFYI